MSFSVAVEKPSNVVRKLTVTVPAETVNQRLESGLAQAQRSAKIKGFRPGHVPIQMVKQYYGEDVKHRVYHDLIEDFYQMAISKEQIRAIGQPQISAPDHQTGKGEHDHGVSEGRALTFTATVEVFPEVQIKNYKGIALGSAKVEVTEDDKEKVLKELLDSQSQLIPAEGDSRSARKGDFLDIEFEGAVVTASGVHPREGMKGNRMVEIGSQSLVPGFEENLTGMKGGEHKTFRIDYPAEFNDKELAGKTIEFNVKVNEIKEKKLPALDDELAKQLGYQDVADLHIKVQEHLLREKTDESNRKLRSDLFQKLIEQNPFEVPSALIRAQLQHLADSVAQDMKKQGYSDEMIREALTHEADVLKQRSESQVRASLILESVARAENIAVTDEELDQEIGKVAVQLKVEEPKMREFYTKNPGRLDDMRFRMIEERATQFLLGQAKIKK